MRISVEETRELRAPVFVDARSPQSYERSTDQIPGSIRIVKDQIDQNAHLLPRGRPIVTYCT